jgi:site-specific recombinase XerD
MHEDGTGMMTGGYIFENNKGSHITPAAVRKHCRKLANDNPMLSGLSPHILRHTFATRANRAGVDLKALQALLGHSQITTTSRYLHPTADDLVAAIDKLGDNT